MFTEKPMPARPLLRRAGFFVVTLLLLNTACGHDDNALAKSDEKGPREIALGSDTMKLPDSVHVATVRMDRSKRAEVEPAQSSVRTGDLLRFIASDGSAHAIAFDGEALSKEARAFLDSTGQMRSPPFVATGATWVVSFKGAPAGKYPYRCPTHGARGEITVTAR